MAWDIYTEETNVEKNGDHQVSFQVISVRSSKVGLINHQVSLPWKRTKFAIESYTNFGYDVRLIFCTSLSKFT